MLSNNRGFQVYSIFLPALSEWFGQVKGLMLPIASHVSWMEHNFKANLALHFYCDHSSGVFRIRYMGGQIFSGQ